MSPQVRQRWRRIYPLTSVVRGVALHTHVLQVLDGFITLSGRMQPWSATVIDSDYWRVGSAPGWTWYVLHSSSGPVRPPRSR